MKVCNCTVGIQCITLHTISHEIYSAFFDVWHVENNIFSVNTNFYDSTFLKNDFALQVLHMYKELPFQN